MEKEKKREGADVVIVKIPPNLDEYEILNVWLCGADVRLSFGVKWGHIAIGPLLLPQQMKGNNKAPLPALERESCVRSTMNCGGSSSLIRAPSF